jgi:exonuclease VII small subunit
VIITKPLFTTNLETSIQGNPQTPEGSILKDLALDQNLLRNVYKSPDVSAVLKKGVNFEKFTTSVSAKLSGTTKLILEVSNTDPETAAVIVNVWADQFTAQINSLFSINEKALGLIDQEVQKARLKWSAAEQVLMEKLPDGIVETRKIELDNTHNKLVAYLNTLNQLDLLTKDAQGLQSRLSVWPDNSQLGIENQLNLIGLYQRAVGGLSGIQIQMTEPAIVGVRTVAEAKASLEALISSLEAQGVELQANLEQFKADMTAATLALESANYQLTQLTTERDRALNAYQALSAQLEETRIDLARDDLIAKVAGQALPPESPVSNRTLVTTMIAGALALVLSCFGVLFINWWRAPTLKKSVS